MRLDEPGAVEALTAALKKREDLLSHAKRRMAELKPSYDEYVALETDLANCDTGCEGRRGLRVQLAFALLYREIGTSEFPVDCVHIPQELK